MYQNPYYQPQLRVVLVNNIDEANRIPADINGNPQFFYNKNTNEIYVKQFFMSTGITTFDKYAKAGDDLSGEKDEKGVKLYEEDFKALNDRIDGLYKMFEKKDAVKNAK